MKSYKRIEALRATVKILRFLSECKEAVSGQEVARAVDVPHGTVMCHLSTLEDERLVRSIGGAWELDMGMALFWARHKAQLAGRIVSCTENLRQLEV